MTRIRVTAMVSTYRGARFLRNCLEDLVEQSLGDALEILVLDSASPENEGEIVREFAGRHPNLRYFRTSDREPSSVAFNRMISVARGEYLTNANTDDGHRRDALELQAQALDEHPEFGIVYADSAITEAPNERFEQSTARRRYDWPDYTNTAALSCCLFGPHPLWRREAHALCGLFDPQCRIADDQDMFLRIAMRYGAVHLRETLGLFLERSDSNSGADRRVETLREVHRVLRNYRSSTPLPVIFPVLAAHAHDPSALAACCIEMAHLCILGPYNDPALALRFLEHAARGAWPGFVPPLEWQRGIANDMACCLAELGSFDRARVSLDLAAGLGQAEQNARLLAAGAAPGSPWRLWEPGHPVIDASRSTRGLVLADDGSLAWTPDHEQLPWDVYEGPDGVPWSVAGAPRQLCAPRFG